MSEYNMQGQKFRSAYSREGTKFGRATAATLDEAGETLLASAKTAIAKYDPNGTALKFAFITDLHRSEEGVYVSNEIDDRYSLRLLSRLCDDVDLDAVFCGGDITNARDENADYFQKNMGDVVADFDDLLPYTNVFSNIGNHDKRYSTSRPNTTNEWLHNLWNGIQQYGSGVEVHYIEDAETNFYVDFTKHKIRIIFIHQYDDVDSNSSWYANENISSDTGIHTHGTTAWKAALPTTDKADWIVGAVIHGADNTTPTNGSIRNWSYTDLSSTLAEYVANGGKGVLGIFAGHYHIAQGISLSAISLSNPAIPVVHVNAALATASQWETADAYCFSVIVVDSSTGLFREIRVGRKGMPIPYCTYFGNEGNKGLLQNGTVSPDTTWERFYCVYNGNHVRFDRRWNVFCQGINFTNLPKQWGYYANDFVTSDIDNVLFSAEAGDVITTEIKFSSDNDLPQQNFNIFSPQINPMLSNKVVAGATYTNNVTLEEDTDVTAIGMYYYGSTAASAGILDFELNVYKNGVRLVRGGT